MFLCVWLYFKKFSRKYFLVFGKCYKEKTNPSPDKIQIDARRSTGFDGAVLRELQSDDRAVDRDLAKHRAASRDRDRREGEITIDDAISRSVDRNLAKHCADRDRREGEFAISDRDRRRWCLRTASTGTWTCERRRLGLCLPLALALSLSLSLSLQNSFEVKIGTEIHFRSQSLFFWVNGNQFPENSIFRINQTPAFSERHFRK